MVGDRAAVVRRGDRDELAFAHQLVEQLRVVHDLVVPVELRVLPAQRVEAVRARGDDLAGAGLAALEHAVEHLDVLLGEHLEQELVARAAGRVAGAGLLRAQHHVVDAGPVQQLGGGLHGLLARRRRTRPRSRSRTGTPPRAAAPRRRSGTSKPSFLVQSRRLRAFCPHGLPLFSRLRNSAPARRGTPTRSAPGGGACRRCGRRARCRPGTAPRTPRTWCTTTARPGRSPRPARRCPPAAGPPAPAPTRAPARSPTPAPHARRGPRRWRPRSRSPLPPASPCRRSGTGPWPSGDPADP